MNATTSTPTAASLPDYAPVPASAFGPAPNEQGYHVGQVERNLYWVTDGVYQAAFLTTKDGVVLFDAPPSIGHNLQRAIDEIAQANGVSNKVTYLVHTHHHADHAGASSLFGKDVVRIGHEETRRLLLRDDDPARPAPDETFTDRRTLEIGGERIELAWHGPNHTPDNILIHFPEHDTLMMVDIVNVGWVPVYVVNLSDDIPGYLAMPAAALTYPWGGVPLSNSPPPPGGTLGVPPPLVRGGGPGWGTSSRISLSPIQIGEMVERSERTALRKDVWDGVA